MSDFVNFKLAQKLKEKGYPQHWSDNDYIVENEYEDNFEIGAYYDRCLIPEHIVTIAAPTISQVSKWLRKENHIHINTSVYKDESEDAYGRVIEEWCFWNWDIQNCNSGDVLQDGDDIEYESYEQAALAGIEYSLDNLI